MAKLKEREQNFEASLATLEQIVGQLESGDLPLERSLELFEEGVALARRCQIQLQDAERKVELLLRERGEVKVVPFETAEQEELPVHTKSEQKVEDNLNDSIPF